MNINGVYENGLCTGCGTCAGLCPTGAIEMVADQRKGIYKPAIDDEKCINCGKCHEICPGHSVDFKELNEYFFGKQPEDLFLRSYSNCYAGCSTDHDIRYNSSSGGLVTQLLIFAIEEGIIDGALVTKMKKDRPLEPEPFIARTKEEIIAASESKFCPVPANTAVREILDSKDGEKFAVVGLPCHIHGIRKAEKADKKLKEKIVLHLGLFCDSYVPTFAGIKYFMKQMRINDNEIKKINYRRGKFPPGMMHIEHRETKDVDHLTFWNTVFRLPFVFSPWRCALCCDSRADLSDASFGSWWWKAAEGAKADETGLTAVICRNDIGEWIIGGAKEKQKINITRIDSGIFRDLKCCTFKEANLIRFPILKFIGKKVPDYNLEVSRPRYSEYATNISSCLELFLASKRYLWSLLSIYIEVKKYAVAFFRKSAGGGKRVFDIIAALLLLVCLSLPLLVLALIIKSTSRGPVLYWSDRVGIDNRIFRMPKFRTMHIATPAVATHLMKNPALFITPVGSFLRKFSLDELPQLFSVLKGDISFVGPRPALYNQNDLIELRTAKGIHKIIPGITGWAQVNGRDELPIPAKVEFDEYYLKNRSFFFDLKILLRTFVKVARKEGVNH